MNTRLRSPHAHWVAAAGVALFCCAKAPSYSRLPKTEAQFCEALDLGRTQFERADSLENAVAKAKAIEDSRAARKRAVLGALPEGSIIGWIARVESVSSSPTQNGLDVRLPCRTKAVLKQRTPYNRQDENFLSTLKIGSSILVSGSFRPDDPSDGFEEMSVTSNGSLREPEYTAGFAVIKPVADPDERYPDSLQPKLLASVKEHRTKFLERLAKESARDDMQRAAFDACTAATNAINQRVKNKTTFPSCFWSLEAFKIAKVSDTQFHIEGPFTFQNAFGAERKAYFEAEVEEGPANVDPSSRYKVVDTRVFE